MVVLARGHSIAKWRKVSNTSHFSYRHVFSLLCLRLLAVHLVVHLVNETDDYFRYFACYEYAKRNNLQNTITLHLTPPCSINLKFLTSFFKIGSFAHAWYSWLCAFKPGQNRPFINYYFTLSNTRRSYSSRETLWAGKGLYMLTLISAIYSNNIVHHFQWCILNI